MGAKGDIIKEVQHEAEMLPVKGPRWLLSIWRAKLSG
jgi:hypothetical protein